MKPEDFDEILSLVRQEIRDAKVKNFDKLLYFLLSEYPSDMILDKLEDKVLEVYKAYKDDISVILRMYISNPKLTDSDKDSMLDYIKGLKDIHDD